MKERIKSNICTNCGLNLQPSDNYCPNCGQENDNKRQSFVHVMSHLILDFLHFDSKVFRSLPALLFKPGFLTKEYLMGKRAKYLEPVKMFITIVVIYFILASFGNGGPSRKDQSLSDIVDLSQLEEGDTISLNDSSYTRSGDTIFVNGKPLRIKKDTVLFTEGPFKVKVEKEDVNDKETASVILDSDDVELDTKNYKEIKRLVKSGKTNTNEILDSLNVEKTFWNRFWYGQAIKFAATEFEQFKSFLYSKLPWLVFLLMPVFALLLKLIYVRRKFLYIDHLIFSFHLHSFFFITGIISILVSLITGYDGIGWILIVTLLYILFAFKNFYSQPWLKTLLKIFTMSILYGISALLFFIFSMVVVFLLF